MSQESRSDAKRPVDTSESVPFIPSRTQRVVAALVDYLLRVFFRVYGRVCIVGIENVPIHGPAIVVSNHASNVDPLLAWAALRGRRTMRGVAKLELWRSRAFACIMNSHGAVSVNRGAADRNMIRTVLESLKVGEMVGLFVEGTRTKDGKLNRAQPGVALLVQKSGAPVIPVGILGTYQMLPRGQSLPKRSRLGLAFGAPIQFPPEATREEVTTALMGAIARLMTENGQPTEAPGPERIAEID